MNTWQKEVISQHLPQLVELIDCNDSVVTRLKGEKEFSVDNIETIKVKQFQYGSNRLSQNHVLLEIAEKKANGYDILYRVFRSTGQDQVANIFLDGARQQGIVMDAWTPMEDESREVHT